MQQEKKKRKNKSTHSKVLVRLIDLVFIGTTTNHIHCKKDYEVIFKIRCYLASFLC